MPTALPGPAAGTLLLLAGALLAACDGGPSSPGGDGIPATLGLSASFSSSASGDEGDAFDAANTLAIRLSDGGDVLFDEVRSFDPTASEHRIRVELELEDAATVLVEVELSRDQDALFRGSADLELAPGADEEATIPLEAVAAAISADEPPGPLASLGETVELTGAVLFVTGDTARSLELEWMSLDPGIAEVVSSNGTAFASAVADGQARIQGGYGEFTEIVTVGVDLQVVSVDVEPPDSEIPAGGEIQLTARARDALDNELPGHSAAWSSSAPSVATVDDGLVRGVGGGTAVISAVVEGVEGTAQVEVVALPPDVTTSPAANVGHGQAQLRAVVNANGSPTTGRFEYGTDPDLEGAATTSQVSLGSAAVDQSVATTVPGLDAGTTYYFRAVATNQVGTGQGEILSFQTLAPEAPSATTEPATDIGTNSATLNASVNPNGAATTAVFQWADNPSLDGSQTSPVSVGDGSDDVAVEADLGDIAAETTHYFRVVASNAQGTAEGDVLTFQTAIPAPSALSGGFDGPTVFLGWDDNSTTDTHFLVERSETSPTSGFEVVGTVFDDGADFDRDFFDEGSDEDPLPTGILYYRVFACNDQECSGPSNVLEVVNLPSIGGYVDYCSDGCDAVGFEVTLTGPETRMALTNSAGFFDFPELPPGTYTVTVREDYCSDPLGSSSVQGAQGGFRVDFDEPSQEVTVSSADDNPFLVFNGNGLMSCPGLTPPPPS